jgi:chemotaxis protein histidine kinase CheA
VWARRAVEICHRHSVALAKTLGACMSALGDALRQGVDTSASGWLWKDHVAAAADEIQALRAQLSAAEAEAAAARQAAAAAHTDAAAARAWRARAQVADALEATLDEALAEVTTAQAELLRLRDENDALTLALAQSELDARELLHQVAQSQAAASSDRDTAARLQAALADARAAAQAQALQEQAVAADEQAVAAECRHEAERARRAALVAAAALVRQLKAHRGLARECATLPVACDVDSSHDDMLALASSRAGLMTAAEATALKLQLLRVPGLRAASSTHLAAVVATARVVSRPCGCAFELPPHAIPATGAVACVATHACMGAVTDVLVGSDVPLAWVTQALAPLQGGLPPPLHCVALTDCTLFVLAPEALRALWATHPRGVLLPETTSAADALASVGDVACLTPTGIDAESAKAHAALAAARAALLSSGAGARESVGKQASAQLATLDALLAQFQDVMGKQAGAFGHHDIN